MAGDKVARHMLELFMTIIYQHVKAKGDARYMYGRLNIMVAIISLHVKAMSAAKQLYVKPEVMLAATYQHVKPMCDAHHMHAKPNTIVAIPCQHVPSWQRCWCVGQMPSSSQNKTVIMSHQMIEYVLLLHMLLTCTAFSEAQKT